MLNGISELLFDDCFFIGNQAKQDKSVSRPIEDGYSYYNGDGGAIQIGCQNSMKKLSVIFNHCEFKNNKAFRHGGAIAIQTIKDVQIKECTFQQNQANYVFPSNNFTLSQQFSKSEAFSVSNKFTNSDKFIKTDCFSQSNGFTESNAFQQTNDFTESNAFQKTIESSVSTAVEEFNNPLYNGITRDPFEQEIDETEL
ncbi:hypothetical protein M9Y10_023918 [Tritrichomonas musculus]|uniref:Right handed beta helix domain-containing protein n=1 Tax=Tritrichomonas musculus TaxID=1915356 RepID=A0ABR2KWI0_9EUKA